MGILTKAKIEQLMNENLINIEIFMHSLHYLSRLSYLQRASCFFFLEVVRLEGEG